MTPTQDGNARLGQAEGGNNETLYMILFIVFGLLFCGMLCLVFGYFWKKNKTQRSEVDFNNAHIKLANGSPKVYDLDVEGVHTDAAQTAGTAGATTVSVDASDGIVAFTGTSTKGIGDSEVVTASYKGIGGMSEMDEDDEKQEVVSYNM